MAISVECPSCRSKFDVEEKHAGKRARCRRCGEVFAVPVSVAVPANAATPGLVPLDPDSPRARPSTPAAAVKTQPAAPEQDDSAGYALAGERVKKAKAVRVRPENLPGEGISAKGVREAAAATRKTLTPAQILAAFGSAIEPVRPSPLYRLWIAIVALLMVLLPLVYLALIGLILAGLVYHAVNHITVFQTMGHGRGDLQWALAIYVGPLIMGAVVVLFMLKPLFARRARGDKQRVLDPEFEPLLHAFVDGVCAAVGAPRPTRIEVNCDVNASARREGLLLGVFGNELVLSIGLPLAAGLTLKQFAGVLAHEFGHFAQGAGMRLYVLIMTINHWFARVVYERDAWDEALVASSKNGDIRVMVLVRLVRLAVWLTRRVLWVLMWVGHLVSAILSRQMEFDADRYGARMVGARDFAETHWRLRVMGLAQNGAFADLNSSWQEKRLPDNFPKLVLANIPQLPKELVSTYREAVAKGKTGWLDLHPADSERIARAAVEEPGEGIFHLAGQGTDVFGNFDAMAKVVTLDLYKSNLGPQITKDQLFPVAELVETQTVAQEGAAGIEQFFLAAFGLLTTRLSLLWEYPKVPTDPVAAKQALVDARNDLRASGDAAQKANERVEEACRRYAGAEYAVVALKAGLAIKPSEFELQSATSRAAEAARDKAQAQLRLIVEQCDPFAAAATRRLVQALAILEADPVADRIDGGRDRREEARALYTCVAHLGSIYSPLITRLFLHRKVLIDLVQAFQAAKNSNNEPLMSALTRAAGNLAEFLEEFRWKFGDTIHYPFEHAQEDITLARFALPASTPSKEDVVALLEASQGALDRLVALYTRALGRLAVTALEVERALGLPPLEPEKPNKRPA
jgi:Zn-dependent protease with chaperone function